MHYGFVAVPATVERLVGEFAAAWPRHEITQRTALPSLDAWFDWKRENERFVSARDWTPQNPGVEVYGVLQDGDWTVLLDTSHVLTTDAAAQAWLSSTFGRCLAFVIETTGGCASFAAYVNGQLLRSIDNTDGHVRTDGEPLPEEAGLDLSGYYMEETEALQQRFGLHFLGSAPPTEVIAIAAIDRTDYGTPPQPKPATPAAAKKPWWQLW